MKTSQKLEEREGHPAGRLAEALARANGILSVLSQCYDGNRGGFAVTDAFLIQSVAAIETFVGDAHTAFSELSIRYDFAPAMVAQPAPKTLVIETGNAPKFSMSVQEHAVDTDLFVAASSEAAESFDVTEESGDRAHSYEELLRKLTAAEVFAQEQQAQTDGGMSSPLLPLLRSLKEDLKKVRAA